jgi:hypothetical protein
VLFIFIGAAQVPILALLFARHVHPLGYRVGRKWFELSIHAPHCALRLLSQGAGLVAGCRWRKNRAGKDHTRHQKAHAR